MDSVTVIYKIESAEVKDVLAHLIKCKDNFIPGLDETVDIPAYSKKIAENSVTFEAWLNDELIGLIAAYINDEKKHTAFITNVSLIKEFSGRGIASQLLTDCINFAKDQNFKEIVLEVNSSSRQALKLYEKFHFSEKATKGDLKIMHLNLQRL